MKAIKIIYFIAIIFLSFTTLLHAQNYSTLAEVISSGGNTSTGGNYSNFGVIGETFVANSVTGGNYNTSIGFLYSSDIHVGFTEIGATKYCSIFPNPTSGKINIDNNTSTPIKTEIYNSFGEIVMSRSFETSINISMLSNGLYFMKLVDKNGMIIHSEKIIKYWLKDTSYSIEIEGNTFGNIV